MLVKLCSNSFKLAFNSMWTKNFQMFKLDLEKTEEPEIKLPTFVGSNRKQENFKKKTTSASKTMLKPLTVWITINCGKFLKRWEYQIALPVSWETCIRVKEVTVRTGHDSKIGEEVWQGCILSSCLFNLYAEYMMQNVSLDVAQAGIKTVGRNINNLIYTDDTTPEAKRGE